MRPRRLKCLETSSRPRSCLTRTTRSGEFSRYHKRCSWMHNNPLPNRTFMLLSLRSGIPGSASLMSLCCSRSGCKTTLFCSICRKQALRSFARFLNGWQTFCRKCRLSKGVTYSVLVPNVSLLLGHDSVLTTEKHYSAWIQKRQDALTADVLRAYSKSHQEIHAVSADRIASLEI